MEYIYLRSFCCSSCCVFDVMLLLQRYAGVYIGSVENQQSPEDEPNDSYGSGNVKRQWPAVVPLYFTEEPGQR